jgi:hypothetical protein
MRGHDFPASYWRKKTGEVLFARYTRCVSTLLQWYIYSIYFGNEGTLFLGDINKGVWPSRLRESRL